MSKVYSAELHRNENASIEFGAVMLVVVQRVRTEMATLATSRKADEYAPGAIHALRKLCQGEVESGQIYRVEVEEWKATFFAWLDRVKKHFPAKLTKKFQTNAEDDFRAILKCANDMSDYFWRDAVPRRHYLLTFKSQAALEAADDAAEKQHPVDLGSALEKYLESCIAKLVGEQAPQQAIAEPPPADTKSLPIRFWPGKKHHSLSIDEFGCFDTPVNLEQDIVVTAYDVEAAVKKYLKTNSPKILKSLRFDCESSLFDVRSADPAALVAVVAALYALAADPELVAG